MKPPSSLRPALAALIVTVFAGGAEASSYTFNACFQDTSGVCDSLATQLTVDVPWDSSYFDLTLANDVENLSSVIGLYFELQSAGLFTGVSIQPGSSGVPGATEYRIRFDLAEGKTVSDIIDALVLEGDQSTGYRIGSHIQGFVAPEMTVVTSTPEPASLFLFGLVAIAAAYRLRRRFSYPTSDRQPGS